jgi:transposase, IS5 family
VNLLWDAGRKCVDLIEKYRDQFGYALPGWRKIKAWRRQLKNCERLASHIVYRGGPNKEARVKGRRARLSGRGPRAGRQSQRQPAGPV